MAASLLLARTPAALARMQARVFTNAAVARPASAATTVARPVGDLFAAVPFWRASPLAQQQHASLSSWLPIGHHSSGSESVRVAGFFKNAVPQTPLANMAKPVKPSTVDLYGETFSCRAF